METLRTSCIIYDIDIVFLGSKIFDLFNYLEPNEHFTNSKICHRTESPTKRSIIDLKYVNNPDFADIHFKVINFTIMRSFDNMV